MSLTILDIILDEEHRSTQSGAADDHDVSEATYNASAVKTAIDLLSLSYVTSPTGFPQHAERTNFVGSSNQVSDYFLSYNGSGAPWPAGGVATSLYVGTEQIYLFATTDTNIVVGRIGGAGGDVALIIGIEETKAGGFVTSADIWTCLFAPLVDAGENLVDSADQLDLSGLIYLGSNFNTATEVPFSDFSDVPSGNPTFNVIFPTANAADLQLLVTGVQGETQKTVNISTNGIGAGSQTTTVGTSIRIDTVKGFVQSTVDDNNELVASAIDYNQHVNVIAGSFELTQTNPNKRLVDINVAAFQVSGDAQEQAFLTDAIATDGAAVQIDVADVRIFIGSTDVTATFGGTITQVGDTVKITNLAKGMLVKFTTDNVGFDRMLITNVDNNDTFDIGNITVTSLVGGNDTEYADLGSHLIYQDDGPNIDPSNNIAPSVTAFDSDLVTDPASGFSGLFTTPDYGADGAGSVSYLLAVKTANVDSGLDDTLTGENVLLSYDSATNTVYGKTSSGGLTVFVITVDSNGQVTLDQQRAIKHGDVTSTSETATLNAADLITVTATAVDSEAAGNNDSDTATVNIGTSFVFTDDGPTITGQLNPEDNDLQVANFVNATDSSSYTLDGGGDGLKSFYFINPDSTGDFTWSYFNVDGVNGIENNEIKGFYKGSALYTLELEDDGTYTINMIGTLPSSSLNLNTAEIKAGGPDTNSIEVGAIENDQFVRISGDSASGAGNINESHAFVGVDNGNLDVGETLTFTLHEANADLINFLGMSIGTKSAAASNYHIVASLVGGGTYETNLSVPKNGTLVIDPPGDVFVTSIDVTKLTGSATKIGLGDIDIFVPANDVNLSFDVQLKDGDNDPTGTSFSVSIDGNNDGNYEAVGVSSLSALSAVADQSAAITSSLADHASSLDDFRSIARPHDWFFA